MILVTKKEQIPLHVEKVKYFKNLVILKFKEYNNINQVEQFRKCDIMVTRENAVKLEENEYFIADLIGLCVTTDEGEDLGNLEDVLQTGANDIYVVKKDGHPEILIPAIKDCILDINMEQGLMKVHLLEGLRELNTGKKKA